MKSNKRNVLSVILAALCAVLLACSVCMLSGIKAKAQTTNSTNNVVINELTLANYDSNNDEVFNRTSLNALYSALTGGTGKTFTSVANSISGTHSSAYGYKQTINLPEYKTANDLYAMNGNKNILVDFGGQTWTVTFLTTDINGHVIATLWLADCLEDTSATAANAAYSISTSATNGINGLVLSKYGWGSGSFSGSSWFSNEYGVSQLRAVGFNAGDESGADSSYATGASTSTTVTGTQRQNHILAPFTLSNDALQGTANAGKSLINFISTPAEVTYTYRLEYPFTLRTKSCSNNLNDALSYDPTGAITGTAGYTLTTTTGVHVGAWYSANVYNASATANNYNDWGNDYVWAPSITEVGMTNDTAVKGLWETSVTGQNLHGNGTAAANAVGSTVTYSVNSNDYIWLRTGNDSSATSSMYVSSNGSGRVNSQHAITSSTLALRPALHLDLTAAEDACAVQVPTPDKNSDTYTGSALSFLFDYDSNVVDLVSITGKTFGGAVISSISTANFSNKLFKPTLAGNYELTFKIKDSIDFGWSDGKSKADTQTVQITVNRKEIADPLFANGKYTGTDQRFSLDISRFKPGDTAGSPGVNYDATSQSFTAVDAGTYSVYIALADPDNYCWSDTSVSEKQFYVTVDKAELSIDFQSSSNSFSFERDSSYTISAYPKDGMGNAVNARISLYYTGNDGVRHNIVIDNNNSFDISDYTNVVGSYTLYAEMYAGTDAPDINNNYTITNASCAFAITEASAGFGSVVLQYKDNTDQYASWQNYTDGCIVYNGKEWAVQLSLPAYMDLDGSYFNYYATNAGSYTLEVQLKITDPEYKFDSSLSDNQFTVLTDKTAKAAIPWAIEKCEVDLSSASWEYSYNQIDWYDFDNEGDPEYTMLGVYVRLSDSYLRSLGLNANSTDSVEITYNDGNRDYNTGYAPFNKKGFNTITAELTINDSNYTISNNTASKTFEITAKQIKIKWSSSALEFETKDTTSYTWGVTITNTDGEDYSSYLEYTFVFNDKDGHEIRLSLDEAREYFKANASSAAEDLINGTVYVSVKADSASDYILTGADLSHSFSVGEGKDTIKVAIEGSGSEYKKVEFDITATFGSSSFTQYLDVEIYSSENALLNTFKASNASAIQEYLNTLDAGNYTLCIVAPDNITAIYAVRPDVFTFVIEKQKVVAPTVENADQIIYKAGEYSIADYLSGFDSALMELDELHSETTGKTAKDYTLTINLLDKANYKFVYPETTSSPVKVQVRAVLTDDEAGSTNMTIASDGSYVDIVWTIQKFVITDSMFSTTTGQLNLPSQFNDILANEMLQVGYQYYADKTSSEPVEELKAGETYYVVASLGGECASNFVFDNPSLTSDTVSQRVTFKSPQSGMAAAMGAVKDFMTKTWLGLPIWAWFLIGLAVLILLIIIIVVACKRRKSKEEREEAKARKEEEKARREEERRLQQERLEAERELAKAKQEAELEKIRAQAGMAGMGMASMAMQQQPAQPQTPMQPQQAQQPQQQHVQYAPDNSVLAEIKAELAEIKARQNAGAGYAQAPMQQMPMQYMNDPVAAAELIRLKAENEAHLRAELERSRSEAERARAEAEIARVRAENGRYVYPPHYDSMNFGAGGDMEKIGALAVAIWKSMSNAQPTAELKSAEVPQIAEESASVQTSHAVYPPDSVVTTTTTVDTTQKPMRRTKSEEDGNFDIDGFYDNADF